MFDFSFAEMLIVGIVALLVIGPERLPTVARKVGTYVARMRRFVSSVRTDVEREFRTDELQRMLQQQQDELQSLKDVVNEARHDADLDSIKQDVEQAVDEVNAEVDVDSAPSTPSPEDKASQS
jgi:sec-independent protein translocase protein TatB